MEAKTPKQTPSKVPQHLGRFHHASKGCSDLITQSPYSYSFAPPKPADPVELCPPHWRLPEKPRLRTKLRAILLKDWQGQQSSPQASRKRTPQRPTMMRMKDSDDYITARAANPRTGLISPSVGSPSPYAPLTPESPAEALKLKQKKDKAAPTSPTPDAKPRPTLRRANEGRKVSAGATWRAHGNGLVMDGATTAASPRVTAADVGAGPVLMKSQPLVNEDQLVKMPSGREPQPYAFPGYSAKQIEAFEHYKQKARRVSEEGYDQRILQAARKASGGAVFAGNAEERSPEHVCAHPVRAFAGDGVPMPNRDITVLKRRARMHGRAKEEPETACTGGAELKASNFAPFSSPKTPILGSDKAVPTSLTTFGPSLHHTEKLHLHRPIARKAVGKAAQTPDLRSLPQVSLPHPSVAALPRPHHQAIRQTNAEPRKCSFGCVKDSENGACMASSAATPPKQRVPLFEEAALSDSNDACYNSEEHTTAHVFYYLSDLLIGALVSIVELCRHMQLPHVRLHVLEVLRSEDVPPQQKMEAMKTVVFSTGQALGLITAVVMVWNLGSMLMQMLEILFWPLTVPFRVLKWVAGG